MKIKGTGQYNKAHFSPTFLTVRAIGRLFLSIRPSACNISNCSTDIDKFSYRIPHKTLFCEYNFDAHRSALTSTLHGA